MWQQHLLTGTWPYSFGSTSMFPSSSHGGHTGMQAVSQHITVVLCQFLAEPLNSSEINKYWLVICHVSGTRNWWWSTSTDNHYVRWYYMVITWQSHTIHADDIIMLMYVTVAVRCKHTTGDKQYSTPLTNSLVSPLCLLTGKCGLGSRIATHHVLILSFQMAAEITQQISLFHWPVGLTKLMLHEHCPFNLLSCACKEN